MFIERALARRLEVVRDAVHETHELLDLAGLGARERLDVEVPAIAVRDAQQLDELEHPVHRPHRVLRDPARDEQPVAPASAEGRHEETREPGRLERVPRKIAFGAHRTVVAGVPAGVREEDPEDAPVSEPGDDEVADVDRVERLPASLPVREIAERGGSGGAGAARASVAVVQRLGHQRLDLILDFYRPPDRDHVSPHRTQCRRKLRASQG